MMENSYHVDNTTVDFSFVLNSFVPFVERQFRKHFLYAEDFMFKLLQNRNSTIDAKDISNLLAHLHIPIIYVYLLLVGILISFLAIPFIYYTAPCMKKHIDVLKYQCCFPIEIMCLVVFAVCWLIGVVGAYQITIQIQDALMIFPVIWRNAMQDFSTNTDVFKMQVRSLVNEVECSTNLITNKTLSIPEYLTDLYRINLNPNLAEAGLRINGNVLVAEAVFATSRFVNNNITIGNSVSMDELIHKIENINRILYVLQENGTKDYKKDFYWTENLVGDQRLYFEPFQVVEWKTISDDLHVLFEKLLPAVNKSLFFLDGLMTKMKNYSKTELSRITSATRTLQELTLGIERNITLGIQELFPPDIQDNIINKTYYVDHFLSSLSLSRNYHETRFVNGSLWIMLIPTIYASTGCIILIMAFYTATDDLKNIFMNVAWTPSARLTSYAFMLFRVSMKYSVTFLWILFILTTIFYCIYLPLSVFCTAAKEQEIFTKYADDPKVWNNKTWLEYKLQNYLPKHGQLLKMEDVLKNCYYNRSLYKSLNMQEYWNVSQHFDDLNMKINIDVLQTMVAKAVREIKLPDEAMQQLIEKLEITEQNLELYLIRPIARQIEKIQFMENMFTKTINEINIYSGTRMQLQDLLNDVKLQTSYTLRELSDIESFSNYLKDLRNEMISVNNLTVNFHRIINETSSIIPAVLNRTSLDINSTIIEIRTMILTRIGTIGNCYVLPYVHDKIVWSVCGHGLSLITGAWITLGLISTSMFFCIIFSCRTCGYIRGSQDNYYIWMQHVRSQRYLSETVKLTGSLMFDRSGNFLGRSITMKEQTEDKAV